MSNAMDKMMDRFRVKVIKKADDDRTSLEGEKFISPRDPAHDGTEIDGVKRPYCVINAHRCDYIKRIFPSYMVSDPFIPGVDTALAFTPPAPEEPLEGEEKK